jgi:DNA-binding NarL/FixJ family response regulator
VDIGMNRSTIVLAEDNPPIAEEIRRLLAEDFEVLAVVGHGEALVKAATRLRPDVVITDISMPGMDGMEAARELISERPALAIVFVTVHDDPALVSKALDIGLGYVLKASAGEELVNAVRSVLDGRRFVSASLMTMGGR